MDIFFFKSEDFNLENMAFSSKLKKARKLIINKTTFSVKTVYAYIRNPYVNFFILNEAFVVIIPYLFCNYSFHLRYVCSTFPFI